MSRRLLPVGNFQTATAETGPSSEARDLAKHSALPCCLHHAQAAVLGNLGRMGLPRTIRLLALALATALVCDALPEQQVTISIDGSGTSNVAPLLWRAMDILKSRTKPAIFASYRSVGTGAGQSEFLSDVSATNVMFAVGDIGLTTAQHQQSVSQGNTALSVPLLLGAVSFFATFPGLESGQLRLSPCTLAKIWSGAITTWDDPAIITNNPGVDLGAGAGQTIILARRSLASSSTFAMSKYLTKAATDPACWAGGVIPTPGLLVTFIPATATAVTSSQGMVSSLQSTAFALGYVESGQGVAAGLNELPLLNPNEQWIRTSDPKAIISPATLSLPTSLTDPAWANADLVYQPGDNLYPMTLVSILYLRTNLRAQATAGFLTRYLVQFLLSDEVAALLPGYGQVALSSASRLRYSALLDQQVQVATTWQVENTSAVLLPFPVGQEDFIISSRRESHTLRTINGLSADVGTARQTLVQGGTYQVHAGGAAQAGDLMRAVMSTLQSQARAPIQASYREVGTVLAQKEFVDWKTSVANLNNFKVGDVPLTVERYQAFVASAGEMMHLPIAVGSVSIFYNQQVPTFALQLNACLLARIYTNSINTWNNIDLSDYNNYSNSSVLTGADVAAALPYLNKPMTIYGYSESTSTSLIFSTWLKKACGDPTITAAFEASFEPKFTTVKRYQQKLINTPELMAQAIKGTPNSIGFLPTNIGLEMGLNEARIENAASGRVLASDSKESLTNTVQSVLSLAPSPIPVSSLSKDWPAVDFSLADAEDAYPMTTLIYAYVARNLSAFNNSGPLTKALLRYMFTPAGQDLVASTGLAPLPEPLQIQTQKDIELLLVGAQLTDWSFETADRPTVAGMDLHTFSAVRTSGHTAAIDTLRADLTALQLRVQTGIVVRAAGSSHGVTGPIMKGLMDELSDFASYPVRMLYEDVDDAANLHTLLYPTTSIVKTRLLVLDQPLLTPQWEAVGQQGVQVLQVPMMIRPLALLYSTGTNSSVAGAETIPSVRISPCNLAKILLGQITKWNDGALRDDNPQLDLPDNTISLYAACRDLPCGSTKAVIDYVTATCPDVPVNLNTLITVNTTAHGGALADIIANERLNPQANNSYTVLAFSSPNWAQKYASFGVKEAALRGVGGADANSWMIASQTPASSFSDLLMSRLGDDTEAYPDPWSDWSYFTLAGAVPTQGQPTAYPLARVDFMAVPADLQDLGVAGGALKGLIEYALGMWQEMDSLANNYPDAVRLPEVVAEYASASLALLTRQEVNTPSWPVIASSRSSNENDRPFITSYVPSSSANTPEAAAATLSQIKVAQLAATTAQLAVSKASLASSQSEDSQKFSDLAYGLAIAALVLALIIALSGLIIALLALRDARRALNLISSGLRPDLTGSLHPSTNATLSVTTTAAAAAAAGYAAGADKAAPGPPVATGWTGTANGPVPTFGRAGSAPAAAFTARTYSSSGMVVQQEMATAKSNPLFGCLPGIGSSKYEAHKNSVNDMEMDELTLPYPPSCQPTQEYSDHDEPNGYSGSRANGAPSHASSSSPHCAVRVMTMTQAEALRAGLMNPPLSPERQSPYGENRL